MTKRLPPQVSPEALAHAKERADVLYHEHFARSKRSAEALGIRAREDGPLVVHVLEEMLRRKHAKKMGREFADHFRNGLRKGVQR
jgi:hypothetical protein